MPAAQSEAFDEDARPGTRTQQQIRLTAVQELHLLDTEPEPAFDELVKLAALICETPEASFTVLDSGRQWSKAAVGVAFQQTGIEDSICAVAVDSSGLTEIMDAREDGRFRRLKCVRSGAVVFYAAVPVFSPQGPRIGTLCVANSRPQVLSEAQRIGLLMLASQLEAQLVVRYQLLQLRHESLLEAETRVELQHRQGLLLEANRLLKDLAGTDELTGLPNRRAISQQIQEHRWGGTHAPKPLSLLMVDIDRLRWVNHAMGHQAGDRVLQRVGMLLAQAARPGETVSRYGGEEFAILMPGASLAAALERAELLRAMIEADRQSAMPITVSIGVACADRAGETGARLFRDADYALSTAKRVGRNQVMSAADALAMGVAGASSVEILPSFAADPNQGLDWGVLRV